MIKEFPVFLPYKDDRTYAIKGYINEVDKYEDNKGYIDKDSGYIYICSKDKPPFHRDVPILEIKEEEGITTVTKIDSTLKSIMDSFHIDKLYTLSYDNIVESTSGDEILYNEEAIQDMNAATSVFIPIINQDDDPLKKIIKTVIIEKKIDINKLKHKLPQKYGLTNMKSALIGKTKMSIINFNIWCELLDVKYDIILEDNGLSSSDNLNKEIMYSSNTDTLYSIKNGKTEQINSVYKKSE